MIRLTWSQLELEEDITEKKQSGSRTHHLKHTTTQCEESCERMARSRREYHTA